ncbi:adenosylcobinamide-GDP ribazoletransferase [Paenibacillus sp. Marseille-P2973]|uniref:adenosylcobinamide-GDP ribazoletransferase n=1 Tax=Paenibacillus sp. Marseille-P2973 TaxID=1871032 RepID=UPI001B37E3FB|nr:adenosylcobinamide-GDP ribazoletransferase [Paenibacillus sp. Marseille-P2973]MBQ4899449.1 adenosylcobinamide-GDP ribazoletransferase [Paenibacillus sp. Marseille-P2973]
MSQKGRPNLAAFQFLSRFPVKAELDFSPELLRRSAKYYPLVGAAIGLAVALAGGLAGWAIPSLPAAAAALIIWVWLTGGLHLDGWMDSADALLSYRSRERMLEIMKDSRVGAMGVLACVLLLLFKVTLISSLLDSGRFAFAAAMLTVPVWSRWFMAWAMHRFPTARAGEGLAGRFRGLGTKDMASATLLALLLTGAGLGIAGIADGLISGVISGSAPGGMGFWLPIGGYFAAAPLVTLAAGSFAASKISARLGGLTGDIYGALNEGLEALLLLVAVIFFC